MKKAFFLALTVLLLLSCEDMNHKKHATARLIKNAVEDIDGNKYDAVKIGNQVWMAENLKTTRYADGTEIQLAKDSIASRYYPGSKSDNVETYGYLYNWGAVMHNSPSSNENPSGVQGICPTGWHVPSTSEWTLLNSAVCSNDKYKCNDCESCIAKALASPTGWKASSNDCAIGNNPETNNATHFSAVPAGAYDSYGWASGRQGLYPYFGSHAYFWTSSGNLFCLSSYSTGLRFESKTEDGYSVRCVKD